MTVVGGGPLALPALGVSRAAVGASSRGIGAAALALPALGVPRAAAGASRGVGAAAALWRKNTWGHDQIHPDKMRVIKLSQKYVVSE